MRLRARARSSLATFKQYLVAHNLNVHPEVAGTNTSVIFEYVSVERRMAAG